MANNRELKQLLVKSRTQVRQDIVKLKMATRNVILPLRNKLSKIQEKLRDEIESNKKILSRDATAHSQTDATGESDVGEQSLREERRD